MNSVFHDVTRCLVGEPEVVGGVRTASFVFPVDFTGFAGHFPGNPVVPGIAQIYAVQVTAGNGFTLAGVRRCKFMRPVTPGETMRVTLNLTDDDGGTRCKAELTAEGEPCASMTLLLAPKGAV